MSELTSEQNDQSATPENTDGCGSGACASGACQSCTQPVLKDVTVKVPEDWDEARTQYAMMIGATVMAQISQHRTVISFGVIKEDENGNKHRLLQHFSMMVMQQRDMESLLELADAINKANAKMIMERASGSVDPLTSSLAAAKAKGNAKRDAESGGQGIIVP